MKSFKEIFTKSELPAGFDITHPHQLDYDVAKKVPHGKHLVAVILQKTAKTFQFVLDPDQAIIDEFGKGVFRLYSPSLDAYSLIKLNINNGFWQLLDNELYKEEGKIKWNSAFKCRYVDVYDETMLRKFA